MPFVKLDTGILNSTLWVDRDVTQLFITALLMAEPFEVRSPMEQLKVRSLDLTGFVVPPGWYGLVPAAGVGIIRRALMDTEPGYIALEKLGSAETESRSNDFEGRRLVRVDGGYIVLNFMKYLDRDYTAAERQKRFRSRKKDSSVTRNCNAVTRNITQAEAEAEADINPYPSDGEFSLNGDEPQNRRRKKEPDPRHVPFRAKLETFWEWANPDLPKFSWGVEDAKQLALVLKKWPALTLKEFGIWLVNYSNSEGIVKSKTPSQFLPRLNNYASGPQDKFHQPKQEKKRSVL